jgi:trehalose 6-phosphate phosphatase
MLCWAVGSGLAPEICGSPTESGWENARMAARGVDRASRALPDALRTAAAALLERPPVGLFTDVDGTISPLACRPEHARVDPEARQALARLVGRLAAVVVLTGRPVAEARRMVGVRGAIYVGNHGLERLEGRRVVRPPAAEAARAALAKVRPRLEEALASIPGILFEAKGPLLGIHYRNAPDPAAARARILAACAELLPTALRVVEGKLVVEVQPEVEFDKGVAVATIARERELRSVIVMGDDRTDLKAFAAAKALRAEGACAALVIGVAGPEPLPAIVEQADYTLADVADVARFLTWLAER